jgi:hypothetical protein
MAGMVDFRSQPVNLRNGAEETRETGTASQWYMGDFDGAG